MSSIISTRWIDWKKYSFKEAVLNSQPLDKWLFVFEYFPSFSKTELEKLVFLSYQDLAKKVIWSLPTWIPEDELWKIIDWAYWKQWDNEDITPIFQIWENQYTLELYHWPTQAFKDVALQFLPRVLSYFREEWKIFRALWASSGDTISAAHFWVWDVEWLQSFFLLPAKWPSRIQKLQATAHWFNNATTILIKWSFDDWQKVIKTILTDPKYKKFKEDNNFITFNSINIARITAQIVYYFKAYLELVKLWAIKIWDEVNFSVPSWNFWDALAWVYAKNMWLPIAKINVATNENDVLHRFLETWIYMPWGQLKMTRAPSQDITVASNFERMLFETIRDPHRVSQLMNDLQKNWYFKVSDEELKELRKRLTSSRANDVEIDKAIIKIYNDCWKVIDPHSATWTHWWLLVFWENPKIPTICLETAGDIKFEPLEWIPRSENWYRQVLENLEKNEEDYLTCEADEESIVATLTKAVEEVNSRTQK